MAHLEQFTLNCGLTSHMSQANDWTRRSSGKRS